MKIMKRKSKKVSRWYILLLLSTILYACMKDDIKSPEVGTSKVQFSTAKPTSDRGRSRDDVRYAIIEVEKADGTPVLSYKVLELYDFNGSLVSEEIELGVGEYSLTEFFLTDDEGNVLFLTPKEGSTYASSVDDPLPMHFEVEEDSVETIVPQVIPLEADPEDYGYATFGFEVVDIDSTTTNESYDGQLIGLVRWDSWGKYIGTIDYDGTVTEFDKLSENHISNFDYSKEHGYYVFRDAPGIILKDVSGNTLVDSVSMYQPAFWEDQELIIGNHSPNIQNTSYIRAMDFDGNVTVLDTLDIDLGNDYDWAEVDSENGYYILNLNRTSKIVIYDLINGGYTTVQFSDSESDDQVAIVPEKESLYGIVYVQPDSTYNTLYSLVSMDYNGNETMIKTYSYELTKDMDRDNLVYDAENELLINVGFSKINFFNLEGDLVMQSSLGGSYPSNYYPY